MIDPTIPVEKIPPDALSRIRRLGLNVVRWHRAPERVFHVFGPGVDILVSSLAHLSRNELRPLR